MKTAIFENLLQKSNYVIENQSVDYIRNRVKIIDWNDRLLGLLGARGTGKTTLMLQHLKLANTDSKASLYLTMDELAFTEIRLTEVAEAFRNAGGKLLVLDEVHKYPTWSVEVKNIHDTYKDLKIIFSGSSVIDILRQKADLSRRAIIYQIPGLSYREYLGILGIANLSPLHLKDIVKNHVKLSLEIVRNGFRPLQYFEEYLRTGYYPYFLEGKTNYPQRLQQVVKHVLETDMQFIAPLDPQNIRKIHQLLFILASNVPFKPNISKLSERIGLHRNTLIQYLHHLEQAKLINNLSVTGKSISTLQKPDKIYLENTNLHYALAYEKLDRGSLREAFFFNQLSNAGHELSLPKQGDFKVDDYWTFEIGGRDKSNRQLQGVENAFIASDDIESGALNKIPLWMFGLLY